MRGGWRLRENDGVICKNGGRKRKRAKKETKGREENNKAVRKKLG